MQTSYRYITDMRLESESYEVRVYWGREFVTRKVMPSDTGNAIFANKGTNSKMSSVSDIATPQLRT